MYNVRSHDKPAVSLLVLAESNTVHTHFDHFLINLKKTMSVVSWNLNQLSSASCEVTGKRLNRGGSYGLEVPCKYKFQGVPKIVAWIEKCIAKENDDYNCR